MLFSKRPSELTPEDIRRVVTEKVPEGSEVEFKSTLPAKKGSMEPWAAGQDRVEDRARNELLAEVVGFANAYGGWLLVGIAETEEKPARAGGVAPIRTCADLAERLRLMCRDCIEPRLQIVEVEGVPMQDDGAGVVVFHVPRSRMAPHRLKPTKECYRRHADRTEVMEMREIQDLTLQVERGMLAIDRRFRERQDQFASQFEQFGGSRAEKVLGIRATLIPLTQLYVDRVHGNAAVRPPARDIPCTTKDGRSCKLSMPVTHEWRSIIRGSISRERTMGYVNVREVHCDGLVEYYLLIGDKAAGAERPMRLYSSLVIGIFCNVLCAAEIFRCEAGMPDAEYGLEFAISNRGSGDLGVVSYDHNPLEDPLGPFPHGYQAFPRYSIGPREEFQHLAEVFERDFWDAVGHETSSLLVVDFDRALCELGLAGS